MVLLFILLIPTLQPALTGVSPLLATNPATLKQIHLDKLMAPELRYQLIAHFGAVWYCPAGGVPLVHPNADEQLQLFSEIQKDAEAFRSIAHHLGLPDTNAFTDEQKWRVYREYEKLSRGVVLELLNGRYKFTLRVRDPKAGSAGQKGVNGFIVEGFIDSKDSKDQITILKKEPTFLACPKCLAGDTRIETPNGMVAISELREGMLVWTLDGQKKRVVVPVAKTVAVPVLPGQQIIHLILRDGRQLWGSPGHPTADGRTLEQLEPNAAFDGSWIERVELQPYEGSKTYDLLPAGETGLYWANGVLLGSTLHP